MRALLFLLLFVAALHAEEIPLVASLKNDPSVLIEGSVNAITGQPAIASEDLLIHGKEPIAIRRFYHSSANNGAWVICPTFARASAGNENANWSVDEPSGCPIVYYKEKKISENGVSYLLCKPTNLGRGWCNTSQGAVSSRTNPQNNTLLVELPHFRHLIVHAADGTVRTFKKSGSLQPGPFDEFPPDGGDYRLLSERHPNGCWTLYDYRLEGEKYLLALIRTMNPSQTKTFASAEFLYEDPKQKNRHFAIRGSDGQRVEYCYEIDKAKRQSGALEKVLFSDAPSQALHTLRHTKTFSIYDKVKKKSCLVNRRYERLDTISWPLGRSKAFHYYLQDTEIAAGQRIVMQDALLAPKWQSGNMVSPPYVIQDLRRGRIKALANPLAMTHSFLYFNGKTSVFEPAGRTDYTWGQDLRIYLIERFSPAGAFLSAEGFAWEGGRLLAKSSFDAGKTPVTCHRYFYNGEGDIVEERFYGNLTGEGRPLCLDSANLPLDNGAEYTSVRYRYASRLPVLEEHSSGSSVAYEYLSGTDLLSRKTTYDRGVLVQRLTFEYNEDRGLVRTLEEDGGAVMRVSLITPIASGSYIGLPETIEEGYFEQGRYHSLGKTILSYTAKGAVERKDVYDADGALRYSLRTFYDERGRPCKRIDALGQIQTLSHDECDNLIVSEEAGVATRNQYDLCNRLRSVEKAGWKMTRGYDERGRLTQETDPYGATTGHVYNTLNQCVETRLPDAVLRREYDSLGGEILSVDARDYATTNRCNAYGKPTCVTYPDGATETFSYTREGWLRRHVDPVGVETLYEYDSLGRVRSKSVASLAQECFEYTGMLLTAQVDAEGNVRHTRYDGAGRVIEEEFDGLVIQKRYDALGRLSEMQQGDLVLLTEFDLLNRVIEERSESASGELLRKTRYAYNEAGHQTKTIRFVNGREAVEERVYDPHGRLVSLTNPLGIEETISYFDTGTRKTVHTDAMGLQTVKTYDARGRLVEIEERKEQTLSLEKRQYDKSGNLSLQENTVFDTGGASRTVAIRRSYDSRNRLTELIEADVKRTCYEYTPRSELSATIKPNGTVLSYSYHALGYLERICSSDGTVDHRMGYNRLGHLLQSDQIQRKVDALGRLLSEIFPQGFSVENSYDPRSRRSDCRIPGRSIHYGYNALDLQTVTVESQGQTLYEHRFGPRDLAGNLLQETLLNGDEVRYTVDPLSRTTALESRCFTQQILEYDRVGNILRMQLQGKNQNYSYDDLYQLTSELAPLSHDYRFDSLHNRLRKDSESYEINALNQIASHMEYDPNGNPTRYGDTELSYDALDRLISLKKPGLVQTFTYDSQHRRLSQTENGVTRYFLYDGQNEIGALDENLTPVELRILGEVQHAEIGAAIAIECGGDLFTPIHDLQGNVAALVPQDNGQPHLFEYSAFGEEVPSNSRFNPWRFSSKRTDEKTGLVYYGRRYYLPEQGRWLTPDPAGFTDGANLYAFVNNDPLTHLDEYGLFQMPISAPTLHLQKNEIVQGINYGLIESCFGTARLLNAAGHGLVSPFHSYDWRNWQTGTFNWSMGSSYHNANSWLNRTQQSINDTCFAGVRQDSWGFQGGRVVGQITGDYIIGAGAFKIVKGLSSARRFFPSTRNFRNPIIQSYGSVPSRTLQAAPNPLQGTTYSKKVLLQMENSFKTGQPDFHGFPRIVDNYANLGQTTLIKGRDGVTRIKISLEGGYKNLDGHFEWIIEENKLVNHRLFVPKILKG